MGAGQAKLELLLELRNRIKGGLSSARQELNKGVSAMKGKLSELRESHGDLVDAITSRSPIAGQAIEFMTNPYVAATAAVLALVAAYAKAVNMAANWAEGMAKVNVTAQLGKNELGELSEKVMSIASMNATPLEDAPEAFNKIVSAGLDAKEAIQAFDPILKGAKAGFTDLETVAAATVATMNSTGWKSATDVLDVLFATMNKGNAEFADISNYLPKIIPMSQKAGQTFQDTAGAFAYLTAQGFKAEAAATGLENVMKAISDPRVTDGFKKVGINIYDATGKARPLLDVIKQLQTRLSGLSDKDKAQVFKNIGMDGEATTAIGAMLKDYDKLNEIISFTNDSQGQLNEAVKNASTPMDVWSIVSNQVKAAMIGIGQTGLPIIKTVGQFVLDVILGFKNLYNESVIFRDILSSIGWIAETSFKMMLAPIRILWNTLHLIYDALQSVTSSIFGAGIGFEQMYLKVKPYILWIYQYLAGVGNLLYSIVTRDLSGISDSVKALANAKSIETIRKEVQIDYTSRKKKGDNPLAAAMATSSTGTPKVGNTGNPEAAKVTGRADQIKNLTINMDAMVKMGDFVSTNPEVSKMSKRELEQWFTELCARMIRNLETSYS